MLPPLAVSFLRWTFLRAACARGWWLCTSVYLVVEAGLSPFQLVFIGTLQGLTVVIAEVPAGVLADTVSRRLAMVVAQVTSGLGMLLTGFVTDYPLVLVAQCSWGLGWAFSSGADIAWITDELGRPDVIDRVLARRARWELAGAIAGTVAFGLLAWATSLSFAIVVGGALMVLLGALVARFPEHRFTVERDGASRWAHSLVVVRRGVSLARRDRIVLVVIVATLLINGGREGYGRLLDSRLLFLGFARSPSDVDPIVWFAVLNLVCFVLGMVVLRIVEAHIERADVARRTYALACAMTAIGVLVLAHAPSPTWAVAGVLVANGLAFPLLRPVGDIWVNRRCSSDVRATVHSFSSQAENLGEIVFGFGLALAAGAWTATVALTGSVALFVVAGVVVVVFGSDGIDQESRSVGGSVDRTVDP